MIVSKTYKSWEYLFTHHRKRIRVRAEFTFDDGSKVRTGPDVLESESEIEAHLDSKEPRLVEKKANREAEEDVRQDRQAKAKNVKEFLRSAMEEKDPAIALRQINKAQAFFADNGWTPAQIKSRLNISDDQWSGIIARRNHLNSNAQTLIDYQAVLAGDTPKESR